MPDVQEVFRMATQKVRQDPGALDRQVAKQRKAARNRRVGAFAMVLALVAAAVAAYALTRGERRRCRRTAPRSIGPGAGPGRWSIFATGDVTPLRPTSQRRGPTSRCPPTTRRSPTARAATHRRPSSWRTSTGRRCVRSRSGTRCLRRTVVPGRLDDRVPAAGRLDPASREPLRPGRRRDNGRESRTSIRRSSGGGGSVPELRAGWSVDPLPAAERRPATTRTGTSGPCRSPAGSRPSFGTTPAWGGYSPDGGRSRTSHRSTRGLHRRDALDRERRRGNPPTPGPGGPHVAEVVPGWDADLVLDDGSICVLNVATGSTTGSPQAVTPSGPTITR